MDTQSSHSTIPPCRSSSSISRAGTLGNMLSHPCNQSPCRYSPVPGSKRVGQHPLGCSRLSVYFLVRSPQGFMIMRSLGKSIPHRLIVVQCLPYMGEKCLLSLREHLASVHLPEKSGICDSFTRTLIDWHSVLSSIFTSS